MKPPRIARLLLLAAAAAGGTLALRAWVAEPIVVVTGSMEPTIPAGTYALVYKLAYRGRPPARGDIVVLRDPDDPARELVKRVIAVPGDTVELRAKKVYLDGKPLEEPYALHARAGERLKGDDLGPVSVGPRALFVLGDNRDESLDSTAWRDPETGESVPLVPFSMVRGKVLFLPGAGPKGF